MIPLRERYRHHASPIVCPHLNLKLPIPDQTFLESNSCQNKFRLLTVMRRSSPLKQLVRLGLMATTSLAIALLIIIFSLGPAFIAQRLNPVSQQALPSISSDVQALHDSLTIIDLHADSLLWGRDLSQQSEYGHVDVPRLLQGNIALQIFTVVTQVPTPLLLEGNPADSDSIIQLALLQRWPISTWLSLAERALYQAKQLQRLEQKSPDRFQVIENQQDLNAYLASKAAGQPVTAGLLGLEGAQALEGHLDTVNRLYDAGFRMIGLSHFFDNEVAGSAHGLGQAGLTPLGQNVIQRMAELNMLVDLAHASPQTIDDVLQITERPVLVSHTGVQGTCAGVRNLSDRQLQQIASTGGVIGIGFWRTAVCGDDVGAIVRAIRYVVEQVGIDHVALGSDFDGAVRVPFDVANMNQLTQGLQENGFTAADIRKIMGLNILNLLQQFLPAEP